MFLPGADSLSPRDVLKALRTESWKMPGDVPLSGQQVEALYRAIPHANDMTKAVLVDPALGLEHPRVKKALHILRDRRLAYFDRTQKTWRRW